MSTCTPYYVGMISTLLCARIEMLTPTLQVLVLSLLGKDFPNKHIFDKLGHS